MSTEDVFDQLTFMHLPPRFHIKVISEYVGRVTYSQMHNNNDAINRNSSFINQVISSWSSQWSWPRQAVHLVLDGGHRQRACDQRSASWQLCELRARVHSLQLTASSHRSTCATTTYLLSNISHTFQHQITAIKSLVINTREGQDAKLKKCTILLQNFRQTRPLPSRPQDLSF